MYKVTHNGFDVEFFDTEAAVEGYIAGLLEPYAELDPKEIYRGYGGDNKARQKLETIKSVVIWQYSTLYTEVFMFEQIGSREE